MLGAPLARRDAAQHPSAELQHLLGVEGPLTAGHALDHDLGISIEQDAHWRPSLAATSSTIFCAASGAETAGVIPASSRIFRPSASLVPVIRTTSGSLMSSWSRAEITPLATSSPR